MFPSTRASAWPGVIIRFGLRTVSDDFAFPDAGRTGMHRPQQVLSLRKIVGLGLDVVQGGLGFGVLGNLRMLSYSRMADESFPDRA